MLTDCVLGVPWTVGAALARAREALGSWDETRRRLMREAIRSTSLLDAQGSRRVKSGVEGLEAGGGATADGRRRAAVGWSLLPRLLAGTGLLLQVLVATEY